MVCKVKFPYRHKITPEQKSSLERLIGREISTTEDAESPGFLVMTNTWDDYYADPADLIEAGIFKFEISEALDTPTVRVMNRVMSALDRFDATLASMRLQSPSVAQAPYNERCGVHVPGVGLLLLNEVRVLEDCCTDRLQEHLDAGWRIIAACPQPNSRRPDYVVGRTKA